MVSGAHGNGSREKDESKNLEKATSMEQEDGLIPMLVPLFQV